jgi:hypothetical protein
VQITVKTVFPWKLIGETPKNPSPDIKKYGKNVVKTFIADLLKAVSITAIFAPSLDILEGIFNSSSSYI